MRELLSIVVITVLSHDIRPVSGHWETPQTKGHMIASLVEPAEDIEVLISDREETRGVAWEFAWTVTK